MKLLSVQANLLLSRRKILASGLIAFVGGALLGAALLNLGGITTSFSVSARPLLQFSSYEELVNFVNASSGYSYFPYGRGMFATSEDFAGKLAAPPGYSTTNIQVEGVDEADVVETDGTFIYAISNQSLFILKAYPPEEARILSRIRLNQTIHGIFINENKLAVLGSSFEGAVFADEMIRRISWPPSTLRTFIVVYDVTNKETPSLTRNVTLDGAYFSSRMIGNYVYAVINEPAWFNGSEVKLPRIHLNDDVREASANDIYYSNTTDYGYTYTTIVAVNVQNDAEEPTSETILLGASRNMYVSPSNIYLTLPDVSTRVERTLIYRIQVEDGKVEVKASGEVPGTVLNQFSMDEYDNHFRIATTTGSLWSGKSQNHVYVLNMSLGTVGRLEGLAEGERIYSARFMGDRFYLVTFRKVDPLFVIDLQNPENPWVLGELKITGYSDYLHPYDKNHVIGIGKETESADWEDFSWYQGVKISLFDVSDAFNPQEISKTEIGDRGTDSPVLNDHKAFLFDKEKELLVIPILLAEIDEEKYPDSEPPPNAYGDFVWQGALVYTITLKEGLVLRGNVTHVENGGKFQSSYYYTSPYMVKRALYIDNVLYTISDRKIKLNSLDTLNEIIEITLPN